MKKIFILLVFSALVVSCADSPDERVFTAEMDVYLPEDPDWINTTGQLVIGEPAAGAKLNIKVANSYDRTARFSVAEQYGVYMEEKQIRLAAGPSISEVSLPLEGVVSSTAPDEIHFTVKVVFDGDKVLTKSLSFEVRENPPFEFLLNADKSIRMTGSTHLRGDYNYFILGDEYDSSKSQAYFELEYQNGFGREVSLEKYTLEKVSRAYDAHPQDAFTVSLAQQKLPSGAAAGKIRFLLGGSCRERMTFVVKDIELKVGDNLYKTSAEVVFPQPKFRIFNMMLTHDVAAYNTNPVIGYDTLHVFGSDGVERVWIDQPLGSVDNPGVYPFLYQWGRKEDGHQYAKSTATDQGATSATNDPSTEPANRSRFIRNTGSWQPSPALTDAMWSAKAGTNGGPANPCPAGYRVPTSQEMDPLGLNLMVGFSPVMATGRRAGNNGNLGAATQMWSCTPNATNVGQAAAFIPSTNAINGAITRASGASVRCINIPEGE